jgi:hypothetical protein
MEIRWLCQESKPESSVVQTVAYQANTASLSFFLPSIQPMLNNGHYKVLIIRPNTTIQIYSLVQGVYKRMVRFQKFIKRLHSATGRCFPPPYHFHRNVRELLNRVLQQRWDRTCCKWRQPHTHTVWDEFDYRVDVCRVTQGAYIEGLWLMHKKLGHLPLVTVYVLPV